MDTAARAMQSFDKDARFRALAMSSVARAQNDFGRVNPENADRDANEIALRATALLLQQIFENDAELFAARTERDHYKKLTESALLRQAPRLILLGPQSEPTELP